MNLYVKPADGSGEAKHLLASEHADFAFSWSQYEDELTFTRLNPDSGLDIWVLPLEDGEEPRPFRSTPFRELDPAFSPDGSWVAYVSDESGRNEVYVQPREGSGRKWQVSTDGGDRPRWAPSGRELFYFNGGTLMSVSINFDPDFQVGRPTPLFERPNLLDYDIFPDGQRFVIVESSEKEGGETQLAVILNWFDELKRLVPTH